MNDLHFHHPSKWTKSGQDGFCRIIVFIVSFLSVDGKRLYTVSYTHLAIESLTLEDMDTYTTISKKIQKEDVFSLVDTYFMPYGVECDQYSILGEITECRKVELSLIHI